MPALIIAAIVFGTVAVAELPDTSGLAAVMLGARYRPSAVLAGTAAALALHVALAVTAGSLLALLPHRVLELILAAVFVVGAALILRAGDDDEVRMKAGAAGFWAVAATSFGAIVALWSVAALAITGGRGLLRVLPMRWISRLAALIMVVMAGFALAGAFR